MTRFLPLKLAAALLLLSVAGQAHHSVMGQFDTNDRVTVTGTVSKVAVHENDYGYRKVMTVVLDNGARVWGTVPAAIYEVGAGDTVTFTATFSRSDRDETFGFFKRPSKASMVRCEAAEAC